jgi:hypothetical protein
MVARHLLFAFGRAKILQDSRTPMFGFSPTSPFCRVLATRPPFRASFIFRRDVGRSCTENRSLAAV